MALYFKSGNNDASLKTATPVGWAGIGRRRYTHFIAVDTIHNTSFNPQYFWVNGNVDASNSHTIRCNYDSASLTSLRVRGIAFVEAVASNSGITGYRRAILAVSGTGKDDGSNVSGYYARMFTIDSSGTTALVKSSWSADGTGGANDLKPSPLVIGDVFAQDNTRNVRDTSIYYAGSVDRFLSDDEIIGMGLGEIQPLDHFGDDLVELWDFQQDSDRALMGLIQGTQLVPKGTKYEWTTDAPLPVSRNAFIGIGQPNILTAPAWLSTLDSPAAGSETINCTPAAIGTEGQAAGVLASEALQTGSGTLSVGAVSASIVELATIGCTATALSVGGEPCAIHQQQAINCTAADTAVSGQQASIVEAGQDTIACTAAAVSLAAAAAQQVEAGSSTINCTSGALSVTAPAAGMVEAGDSVIGCVSAPLSVGAHAAALIEAGSSIVNCTVGALSVTAPPAGIIEVGDSIIGCSTAALSLSSSQAAVVESGTSVIGCAAASLSISGTTASITDSMGVRTAAVVLDTPGCSIHDFYIIGASSTDLSIGSSVAGMVEVGEAVIGTGYADIGITTTPCALITTDAEPIITNIGLVASINQPSIFASIPNITITAKV